MGEGTCISLPLDFHPASATGSHRSKIVFNLNRIHMYLLFPTGSCLDMISNIITFSFCFPFVADLCTPRYETEVLSPRKVMMAVNYYNHNFNLTNQQVKFLS